VKLPTQVTGSAGGQTFGRDGWLSVVLVNAVERATCRPVEIMPAPSLIGCLGRVTASGSIRPGRVGEVMLSIGGGVQAFLAREERLPEIVAAAAGAFSKVRQPDGPERRPGHGRADEPDDAARLP
jgi:hypothetical protein